MSIKARQCADGGKQQGWSNNRYATSVAVFLEMILITSFNDTSKEHDVTVVDIPGSFLATDMDKIVHMVLCGRLTELMAQVDPSIYRKYVRVENG